MGVTGARRIVVSEAVDETDLRVPQQDRLDVDDGTSATLRVE
jgi:hypothetical protein